MEGVRASKELSSSQELDTRKEGVTTHGGHWGTLEDHQEGPGQVQLAKADSKES